MEMHPEWAPAMHPQHIAHLEHHQLQPEQQPAQQPHPLVP